MERSANRGGLREWTHEPCVHEARAGNARSPSVAELLAHDLLEAAPRVEAHRDRTFGLAGEIDRAGMLARGGAIDHERSTRHGLRLRRRLGEALASGLRADLAERIGEGASIIVASCGVPCFEERALERNALTLDLRTKLAERTRGGVS